MTSDSSISVAAAEAVYKKEYPNVNVNDSLFDATLPEIDTTAITRKPPLPEPSSSTGSSNSHNNGGDTLNKEIMTKLNTMQEQMQEQMMQLTTVILEVSNRLSAVEYKVDSLVERK